MKFDTLCIHFKGDRYNPIYIPYKYILHLDFQNMTNAYFLNRTEENVKGFEGEQVYSEAFVDRFESAMAEKVFVNIHKDANTEIHHNNKYKTSFEKLLRSRDIFYFEFLLGRESIKKVRVPWNNRTNLEEYNELEFAYLCPNGNLGIKIKS